MTSKVLFSKTEEVASNKSPLKNLDRISESIKNSMHLSSIKESDNNSDSASISSLECSYEDEPPEKGFEAVKDKVEKTLEKKQVKPEELSQPKTTSIVTSSSTIDGMTKEGMLVGEKTLRKESSTDNKVEAASKPWAPRNSARASRLGVTRSTAGASRLEAAQ